MQLLYFKNKIAKLVRGSLPSGVFIWNLVLIVAVLTSILLIGLWYYKVYNIYYGYDGGVVEVKEYKPKLDIAAIEQVYKDLELDFK